MLNKSPHLPWACCGVSPHLSLWLPYFFLPIQKSCSLTGVAKGYTWDRNGAVVETRPQHPRTGNLMPSEQSRESSELKPQPSEG